MTLMLVFISLFIFTVPFKPRPTIKNGGAMHHDNKLLIIDHDHTYGLKVLEHCHLHAAVNLLSSTDLNVPQLREAA